MKWMKYLLFAVCLLFLSACSEKGYEPISENISFAATVNIKDMTVSFVDVERMELFTEWELYKPYTGGIILPDGDSFLLYGKSVETADIFSLKTGEPMASLETGEGIVNAYVMANGETVLVNQNSGQVLFLDQQLKQTAVVKAGQKPITVAENGDGSKLFVLSFNNRFLTVVDTVTKTKLDDFPIHPSASGALYVNETGELWLGGHGKGVEIEKNIHIYNPETGTLLRKIEAPTMPVNFLHHGSYVYVLSHGSNQLYKMDMEGNLLASNTIGANPFEIAMTGDGKLMIAGYDSNDLFFIDQQSLNIVKKVEIGSGPFKLVLREKGNE